MTRRSVLLGALAAAVAAASGSPPVQQPLSSFCGGNAGEESEIYAIKLCWCPPGRFDMGSPPGEPERRPGEDQIEVTLTRGFWMAKHETTQGQWRRIIGKLPGELTAEVPAGDDFPVGNVNFAEAALRPHRFSRRGRSGLSDA